MHRREFLQRSVIATLASSVLADKTLARALQAPAGAPPAAPLATPRALTLDSYSRFLNWLRTPDEVAEATIEITCGGVMVSVGTGSSHVDIAKVKTDLPVWVNAIRKHGLKVRQIRGGGQTAVDADVENLVGTMSQLGVTHYWLGTDQYDLTKPIMPQLDAIKTKVEKFVALNQKHGTTLMYHTRNGVRSVGSTVWDLLYVFKDFDPKYVGFHWDMGHMAEHGTLWEPMMRAAGPYVVGMAWKDEAWEQNLGLGGETGPYPGTAAAAPADGRGGAGGRGAGGGRGGGGAAPGGRGGAPAVPGAPAGAGPGAPGVPAGNGGGRGAGRGGGAAAGGPAGPGGAPGGRGGGGGGRGGGRGAGDLSTVPRPLAGTTFARGGGWSLRNTPVGMGMVNIFQYATVMRDINFNGVMELECEYPLGGANSGATAITLPRIQVLGSLKRDVLTIRAALAQSGTGLTI
ncbi:MAG TPA: hypothetical protein VL243_10740 [Vicinamibacterales bacterium]|nr:hypothetical protein [Vicinamibacterales bacterium]